MKYFILFYFFLGKCSQGIFLGVSHGFLQWCNAPPHCLSSFGKGVFAIFGPDFVVFVDPLFNKICLFLQGFYKDFCDFLVHFRAPQAGSLLPSGPVHTSR